MLNRALAIACLAALPGLAAAQAAGQPALYTASLAATCANCHGTNGRPVEGSPLPPLAGMQRAQFIATMGAFKAGTRPATIMHQLAKGYSDEQISRLADYFAAQK